MNRIAFLVLAASVAQGIDLRPPCDRSVLLEAPGKRLWATCASKTGLDIDSILVPSNEAKLCSVPECVYVVQKAAVLTTCDDAALFAQLCKSNATASLPTVSPTTTNPSTVTTTTSPATTAATPAQTTSQPTTSLPPTDSTTTVSPESTPIPTAAAVAPTTSQANPNGANTFAAAGIAAVAIISAIVI